MKKKKQTYEELAERLNEQKLLIDKLKTENISLNHYKLLFEESLDLICICGIDGFYIQVIYNFSFNPPICT